MKLIKCAFLIKIYYKNYNPIYYFFSSIYLFIYLFFRLQNNSFILFNLSIWKIDFKNECMIPFLICSLSYIKASSIY